MPTILIIHGAGSTPEDNWFPWLKQKLEAAGFKAIVPQLPNTPTDQTLNNWLTEIEKYDIDDDMIAVGHSLGAPFLKQFAATSISFIPTMIPM